MKWLRGRNMCTYFQAEIKWRKASFGRSPYYSGLFVASVMTWDSCQSSCGLKIQESWSSLWSWQKNYTSLRAVHVWRGGPFWIKWFQGLSKCQILHNFYLQKKELTESHNLEFSLGNRGTISGLIFSCHQKTVNPKVGKKVYKPCQCWIQLWSDFQRQSL